jgi:hypothetical protein
MSATLTRCQGYSGGDFELANNLSFCYQHDARLHPSRSPNTTTISLFNNDNSAVVSHVNQSTGIFLSVDERTMTASLLQELVDPDDAIYSVSQGNMEVLPSGNSILGYGSVPTLKEFDQNGNVVLSVSWGEAERVQSYRAYKAEWVGKPNTNPDVYACKASSGTEVFMSWNGATEHHTWTIFGGAVNGSLSKVISVDKAGFETKAVVEQTLGFVKVEASGKEIETGVSDVVAVSEMC